MSALDYVKDTVFEVRQNIIDAADEAIHQEDYVNLISLFDALDTMTDLYVGLIRSDYEQQVKNLKKKLKESGVDE